MNEKRFSELAEKYFDGSLSQNERELFDLIVSSNDEYRALFAQYQELFDTFTHIRIKNSIGNVLNETNSQRKSIESKPRSNQFLLIYRQISQYSAAAVIALLVVVGTLYITGYFSIKKEQVSSYTQLKNNLIDISKLQTSIINSFNNGTRKIENYASGTCFPVSTNGYFVTSLHLVRNFENAYVSSAKDTTRFSARIILKDSLHDIAIIKVVDTLFQSFKSVPFIIKHADINIGEYVFTLGYSKNDVVFNDGTVSSSTGYMDDSTAYQLSIPANPGNSGGPILNNKGEVVGILLAKNLNSDNATYALKSNYIYDLVQNLTSDTLEAPVVVKKQQVRSSDKVQMIKQIQPFIFKLEVY